MNKKEKALNDLRANLALDILEGVDRRGISQYNLDLLNEATSYDSTADTLLHIKRVNELLLEAARELLYRAKVHDTSKCEEPEKSVFDEFTPKLKASTYGSEEYKGYLKSMQAGLDHHYAKNPHHPEHYDDGVNGMNLFDLLEMLLDWKAATERHENGDIHASLKINKERFSIDGQTAQILENTVKILNW